MQTIGAARRALAGERCRRARWSRRRSARAGQGGRGARAFTRLYAEGAVFAAGGRPPRQGGRNASPARRIDLDQGPVRRGR
jgi:hypothetical protein